MYIFLSHLSLTSPLSTFHCLCSDFLLLPLVQEGILRAVPGEGQTDGQGVRLQEIPQEGWQESPQGCQERNHDPEIVRSQSVDRWMYD